MSHLPFTLLAYFLNSVAVLVDKFLLVKYIQKPLVYVFYISLWSMLALAALPWTKIPSQETLLLASLSTLLWTGGVYVMFTALRMGQASRVIPVIGTLIPVLLLIHAVLTSSISGNQILAVSLLVLGLLFLVLDSLKGKLLYQEFLLEFLAALLFTLSYLILELSYKHSDFLTVFAWSRFILVPLGILIFAVPDFRRSILFKSDDSFKLTSKIGLIFLFGQIAGGLSEVLLRFSISLATPALVNSLQGAQYVFLLIFSLGLSKKFPQIYKENFGRLTILTKSLGIIFVAFGLFVLSLPQNYTNQKIGLTYSPRYAQSLGLDPKQIFLRSLDELNVKYLRLPVYWDDVEQKKGVYDFKDVDFYLGEAQKRGVQVILVVGYKQPRWPECYNPSWAKNLNISQKEPEILNLVKSEVEYFKKYPNISYWQVENEPLVNFGYCEAVNPETVERVKKEIALVKALDFRAVLITDSGELSIWKGAFNLGDIFGTTLYRTVWNPLFGQVDYPLPPFSYQFKNWYVETTTGTNKTTIVSELQTEPWVPAQERIDQWEVSEQLKAFPPGKIVKNLNYAKETSFPEIYLWGVEWWFWMEKQGNSEYLKTAKTIFK